MKTKKIISLLLIILGLGLIGTAMYINSEVETGKHKISRAQSQVDQGKNLFSLNPVTKEVGKGLTGGAQKKINEGKQQVTHYEGVAKVTQISGIILLIIGIATFFCCRKSSK